MKFYKKLSNSGKTLGKHSQFLFAVASLVLLLFFQSSCRNGLDCASPPPSFYFQIQKDGITYPSQKDTLRGLGIYYITNQQTKVYVPGIIAQNNLYESSTIISMSQELNHPEFIIEIEGQTFTKLKLETSINKTRCNSWPQVSKAYADGTLVDKNPIGVYTIAIK